MCICVCVCARDCMCYLDLIYHVLGEDLPCVQRAPEGLGGAQVVQQIQAIPGQQLAVHLTHLILLRVHGGSCERDKEGWSCLGDRGTRRGVSVWVTEGCGGVDLSG